MLESVKLTIFTVTLYLESSRLLQKVFEPEASEFKPILSVIIFMTFIFSFTSQRKWRLEG